MNTNCGKRLREWRKSKGFSQRDLAKELDVSQSYVGNIEAGRSEPSRNFLRALSDRFNVSADWLLTGIGSAEAGLPPDLDRLKETARALGLEFVVVDEASKQHVIDTDDDGGLVRIPRFAATAAAGNGAINLDGPPEDHVAFPRDWLSGQGLRPATSFLMTVRGDSMMPTLADGDLVMVDRARAEVASGRIYAYNDPDGHGTRLKRLHVDASGVVVRSDNPAADPALEIWTAARADELLAGVIGEAVWCGHRLP